MVFAVAAVLSLVPGVAVAAPDGPVAGAGPAAPVACPGIETDTGVGRDNGEAGAEQCQTNPGSGDGSSGVSYPNLERYCRPRYAQLLAGVPVGYRLTGIGEVGSHGGPGIVLFYQYDARPPEVVTVAYRPGPDQDRGGSGPVLALATPWLDLAGRLLSVAPPEPEFVEAVVECFSSTGAVVYTALVVIPAGEAAVVDPLVLRDRARARIVIGDPPLASSPPLDEPGRFGVVQIPTWLWLQDGYWVPLSEAEAEGGLTVTVTATPLRTVWLPGDGASVTCDGPGLPYQPGLDDSATDCRHTYTSSSADQPGTAYQLGASVEWEFTWTLNGAPQGAFGTVTAVAPPVAYQVGEIQALESGG